MLIVCLAATLNSAVLADGAPPCPRKYTWLAQGTYGAKVAVGAFLRTTFFPWYAAYRYGLRRRPIGNEAWHLLSFGALALGAMAFNPWIDDDDFRKETKEFDDDDGFTVYVNMDPPGDIYHDANKHYFEKHYREGKRNAVYIEARNFGELIQKLEAEKKKKGHRLHKLEISGHGFPGEFASGENGISGKDIAMYRGFGSFPVSVDPKDEKKTVWVDVPKDLFDANAKIRVHACLTGKGYKGNEFLHEVGRVFLSEGGTVYGSTRILRDWNTVRQYPGGDFVTDYAKPLGYYTTGIRGYAAIYGNFDQIGGFQDTVDSFKHGTKKVQVRPRRVIESSY